MLEARVEPSHGFDMFSAQEEVQAGQQAAAQVSKQLPILPDSDPVTIYVQRLGRQLAAHAPGEKWPYSFHVVNQKEINAFALPGGPVFVNLGTIQAADNEAELAGVMAHEISHVVQRHGTRAASKQMAAQLPLAILGGVMGQGALAQMAQMGLGVWSRLLLPEELPQSRIRSRPARHRHHVRHRLQSPGHVGFFHQAAETGRRRARARSFSATTLIREIAPRRWRRKSPRCPGKTSYRSDSAEFRDIKERVGGMKPLYRAADRGTANPGGERFQAATSSPAAACAISATATLRFLIPTTGGCSATRTPSVTIAPPNGVSQFAVAYGMMINTYQPEESNCQPGSGDSRTAGIVAPVQSRSARDRAG